MGQRIGAVEGHAFVSCEEGRGLSRFKDETLPLRRFLWPFSDSPKIDDYYQLALD